MKQRMMIVVLLIGTMISCSKRENNTKNATGEPPRDIKAVANTAPEGRYNPYDFSGIRHNEILGALRSYQKETGDTTRAGMKKFFINDLRARTGRIPDIDLNKVDMLFQRVQQVGLAKFLSGTTLEGGLKEYLIRLKETIEAIDNPDLYPFFLRRVSALEHEASASDLSPHDQEAFLRISSIAFHSGMFWKGVYDTNTWLKPSSQSAQMRWWQWPIVLNADFIGGVLGLVMGGDLDMIDTSAGWMSGGAEGVLDLL